MDASPDSKMEMEMVPDSKIEIAPDSEEVAADDVAPDSEEIVAPESEEIFARPRAIGKTLCSIGCTDTPKREPANQRACESKQRRAQGHANSPYKIHVEVKNIMRPWSSIPGPPVSGRGELTGWAIKNRCIGDTRRSI
jgi:hypothetical protein